MSRTYRKNVRHYPVFHGEIINYCRCHRNDPEPVKDFGGSVPTAILGWNDVPSGCRYIRRVVTVCDGNCYHHIPKGVRAMYNRIDRARAQSCLHRAIVDENKDEREFVQTKYREYFD